MQSGRVAIITSLPKNNTKHLNVLNFGGSSLFMRRLLTVVDTLSFIAVVRGPENVQPISYGFGTVEENASSKQLVVESQKDMYAVFTILSVSVNGADMQAMITLFNIDSCGGNRNLINMVTLC